MKTTNFNMRKFSCVSILALIFWMASSSSVLAGGATYPGSFKSGAWSNSGTWQSGALTGTATSTTASTGITGVGTKFNTELQVGDTLYLNKFMVGRVSSIASDLSLTLAANAASAQTTKPVARGRVPTSSDALQINLGHTVTVDQTSAVANSMTLVPDATGTSAIRFESSGSPKLVVTNGITIGGAATGKIGTITFTSGSTLEAGSIILGNGSAASTSSITMTSGGYLKVGGAITAYTGATFTPGTGTVEFSATNTLPSSIVTSFNILIISGGTTTLAANLNSTASTGSLEVKKGATLAGSTFTFGGTTAIPSLTMETGATGASITGSGALTLGGNITINSGSGANGASIGAPISLGAARTITVADDASAATDLTISGAISGAFAITKAGAGKMVLSGSNAYTGATNINAGTLELGAADRISNSSNLVLNGGTFSTGGYGETLGTLSMTDNSTIALGSGSHSVTFSDTSAVSWTSLKTLTITGWTGTAGLSGTAGKIFIGSSDVTLTSDQLSQISFSGYTGTPTLLSSGQLVPPGIPSTLSITNGSTAHGSSCVGVAATQITYTITNSAVTDVTGVTVTSDNANFVVSSAPSSVAGSGTATYVVTFTPSSAGAKTATISIVSTSPESGINSSLTGTGNALPSPTFTAQPSSPSCLNTDLTYTTQASQSDYIWTIPGVLNSDYSITSGGTLYDNTVTLQWLTAGNKSVSINYNNANGCTAASSVASNTIAVSVTSVAGTATGTATICSGSSTDISVSGYSGSVQWQSSTDNVSFSNIVNATSSTYTVSGLSATKYFKALTGCNLVASNVVTITFGSAGAWLGSTSNDWATVGNWCGGVPSSGAVTIASGTLFQPTISGSTAASAGTISIGSGASLTMTSNGSSTFGAITNAGTFNMSAGTVSVAGITNNKTLVLSGGSLTSSAAITTSDSMLVSGGTLTSQIADNTVSAGTFSQTGGTIWFGTAGSNAGKSLKLTAGTITQTGGTWYTKDYGPTAGTFNQNGANALFVCNHDWKPTSGHTFNSTSGTVQFIGVAGGGATFTSTNTQFNHVIVNTSALTGFSTDASSFVKISGDYTNNQDSVISSATAGNVSFTFNGASNQSISSATPAVNYATFGNVTINNSGGTVSMLSNASVVGNLTVTSGILDLASYTANRTASGGTISVAAGASLKIGGTNTFPTNYTTKTLNTTSTVEYNGTAQTVAAITDGYGHLVLSGGGAKTMPGSATSVRGNFSLTGSGTSATGAAALTFAGNLSIGSGSTFTSGTFTHNLAGNWSNSGTFTAGAGRINFNGTTQSIGGSNPSSFYNATISGGSNKTLSKPITIGNLLTLTSGYIVSDATNKVIISDNANVTGASNASFVLGPIQKIGSTGLTDSTFTFPSGKSSGSVYEPVQIKFLAASSTMAFTVDHYTSVTMSGNLDVAVAANKDVSAKKMNYIPTDEYWDISNDEADGSKLSTSGVDVTIHYHNTNVDLTTYKYILHHTGTLWEVPNRTNQTAFAGLNAGSAIKIPAQKSFSPFTIGGSASALPVTLMNFTAKATPERTAALNWATESESLNKGFAIERQASNVNGKYERIGYVASRAINGNSQTALYYNFIDMHPGTGETVFYRLAQEDMDGKISYTEVRVVKFNGQTVSMIYPNPSTGLINISRTANGSKMNIQVTDMSGKLIQQINNVTDSNYKLNINYSGMYNIKLIYPETGEQTIQKIVVQK